MQVPRQADRRRAAAVAAPRATGRALRSTFESANDAGPVPAPAPSRLACDFARIPVSSRSSDADHEHQADKIGGRIGASLDAGALKAGALSTRARAVAERHLGALGPVTLAESAESGLAAGALASARRGAILMRPGAGSSGAPFWRNALGHELVHVAQQRMLGSRTQHLLVGDVRIPDTEVTTIAGKSRLWIDKVPVLETTGRIDLTSVYVRSTLRYELEVTASAAVVALADLHFLDALYPALEGRVVVKAPGTALVLPTENVPKPATPPVQSRLFGQFGRVPGRPAAGAPPATPAAGPGTSAPATKTGGPAAPAAAGGDLAAVPDDANAYRKLDVPARALKVRELLDKWFSGRDIVQVFQASATEREFLDLEKAIDFAAVLDKLDDWNIVRLAALGPVLPNFAARVNQARADYVEHIVRKWGVQRAEVFVLYIVDTATDDDVEAMLSLLAGDQELYRTVEKMPTVRARLMERGIDLSRFHDREWKATDIATGVYHAVDSVMSTSQAASEGESATALRQGLDLPEPYRGAVNQIDQAMLEKALSPGNVLFGAADQAFMGLPSTVKGVVYDLPVAVVTGIEELQKGHVAAGVEMLTVPVALVISAALGVRAFRRARVAGLLELTAEGRALYDGLKGAIGVSGMQRVAGYVRKSAAARLLVVEAGAEGILTLEKAKGDVAAARALMAERQAVIEQAGARSEVMTGHPVFDPRPSEIPYQTPPDMKVARPGAPLRLNELDPARRYLWILDDDGDFRFASEGQGARLPRRRKLPADHPQAGESTLKHGDLAPGPDGKMRGSARAGGELRAETGADGKPTGRWIMNDDSSYSFARMDGAKHGMPQLAAAKRLLEMAGTDVSKIVLEHK